MTNCGAPCGLCAERCDVIGDHDQHGHDAPSGAHGDASATRFNWDDPRLDTKRGGEPARCGVCGVAPWWILVKQPSGGRKPTCSGCFTKHALKRDRQPEDL